MYENVIFKGLQADFKEHSKWSIQCKDDSFGIFLLEKGKVNAEIEKRKYTLKPGYAVLISPNIYHKFISETPHKGYEITFTHHFLDLYFTPELKKRILNCYNSEIIRLCNKDMDEFRRIFAELKDEIESGGDYPITFAQLMHMFNKLYSHQKQYIILPDSFSREPDSVVSAVKYINSNYREIKSIDEISAACFISKSYLCHVFKQQYNMTVMEYLKKVRIRYACEYLLTTDRPLNFIANAMGFNDLSHFSKSFKQIMGCSPKAYRAQKGTEAP